MRLDLRLGPTTKDALTSSSGSFTQTTNKPAVSVYATVDGHVSMVGIAGQGDFFLKAGVYLNFVLESGAALTFIRDTAASDGFIYITPVD